VVTLVVACLVLLAAFGSVVADEIVAVLSTVAPAAVSGFTRVVKRNSTLVSVKVGSVHVAVPVSPTAGVVQFQPEGDVRATNVVSVSSGSDRLALAAKLGPLLRTVTMASTFSPALILAGAVSDTISRFANVVTVTVAEELLLAVFASGIADEMVTESGRVVPGAVAGSTFNRTLNVTVPTANEAAVQLKLEAPDAGGGQVHPPGGVI
jgi:hypothetical protein